MIQPLWLDDWAEQVYTLITSCRLITVRGRERYGERETWRESDMERERHGDRKTEIETWGERQREREREKRRQRVATHKD